MAVRSTIIHSPYAHGSVSHETLKRYSCGHAETVYVRRQDRDIVISNDGLCDKCKAARSWDFEQQRCANCFRAKQTDDTVRCEKDSFRISGRHVETVRLSYIMRALRRRAQTCRHYSGEEE